MKIGRLKHYLQFIKHFIACACVALICVGAHAEVPINAKTIQQLIDATPALDALSEKYPNSFPDDEGASYLLDGGAAMVKKISASPAANEANQIAKKNGFSNFEELGKFWIRITVAQMAADADISQLEAMLIEQKKAIPAMQEYYKKIGASESMGQEGIANAMNMFASTEIMVKAIKNANPKDVAEVQKHAALLKPLFDSGSEDEFDESEYQDGEED